MKKCWDYLGLKKFQGYIPFVQASHLWCLRYLNDIITFAFQFSNSFFDCSCDALFAAIFTDYIPKIFFLGAVVYGSRAHDYWVSFYFFKNSLSKFVCPNDQEFTLIIVEGKQLTLKSSVNLLASFSGLLECVIEFANVILEDETIEATVTYLCRWFLIECFFNCNSNVKRGYKGSTS